MIYSSQGVKLKRISILILLLVFQAHVKAGAPESYFQENTGILIGEINSTGTTRKCYTNDLGLLIIRQLSLTAIADTDLSQLQVGLMIIGNSLKWNVYHTSFPVTGLTGIGSSVKKRLFRDSKRVHINVGTGKQFCLWVSRGARRGTKFSGSIMIDGEIYQNVNLGKVKEIKDEGILKSINEILETNNIE